jgi:hypothetical protein
LRAFELGDQEDDPAPAQRGEEAGRGPSRAGRAGHQDGLALVKAISSGSRSARLFRLQYRLPHRDLHQ